MEQRGKQIVGGRVVVAAALGIAAAIVLAGCTEERPAYVIDPQRAETPYPAEHPYFAVTVRHGDSIAKIASRYGTTADAIIDLNELDRSRPVYPGQILDVPSGPNDDPEDTPQPVPRAHYAAIERHALPSPVPKRETSASKPSFAGSKDYGSDLQSLWAWWTKPNTDAASAANPAKFVWPVQGPVIAGFGSNGRGQRNDGINIAAATGTPIRAAAAGTVTYAGNELKGYGNLILIKHADGYVTAYAHAASIDVTRGDPVRKGQIIGTSGATGDVDRPQLHFEIRHGTQAVDPELFLESAS